MYFYQFKGRLLNNMINQLQSSESLFSREPIVIQDSRDIIVIYISNTKVNDFEVVENVTLVMSVFYTEKDRIDC